MSVLDDIGYIVLYIEEAQELIKDAKSTAEFTGCNCKELTNALSSAELRLWAALNSLRGEEQSKSKERMGDE